MKLTLLLVTIALVVFAGATTLSAAALLTDAEMSVIRGGCVCGDTLLCALSPCTSITFLCIAPPTAYPAFDGPKPKPQDWLRGSGSCGRKFNWDPGTKTCPNYNGGCGGTVAVYDAYATCEN